LSFVERVEMTSIPNLASLRLCGKNFLIVKLAQPLVDDLDDLPRVTVVKMIGAVDALIFRLAAGGGDDFLGVLVKKLWLSAASNGKQGAANILGVGPAIVAVVFTVFI
jgi:hypothetical protein